MLNVSNLAMHFAGVPVFEGVNLVLQRGEFVALLGESGVGKSTLLNNIAGLEPVAAGSISVAGMALAGLDDAGLARLRRQHLGFVFQAFHVLPHLSVAENVSLPLRLLQRPHAARVSQVLQALGLAGLEARMPAQLSGGQLQRVAIARAVVHEPGLILADEPTGNLDPGTAQRVLDALHAQVRHTGAACLLATHSLAAAQRADRVLRLTPQGVVAEAGI